MTNNTDSKDTSDHDSSKDVIEETVDGQRDSIEAFKEELAEEDDEEDCKCDN